MDVTHAAARVPEALGNARPAGPRLRPRYDLFLGGEWVPAADGATYRDEDPCDETTLAEIAAASEEDVDRVVRAARRGYDKYWRKIRPSERAKYAFRFARALAERAEDLAARESVDAGVPIRIARERDVPRAHAQFFYDAGWADKLAWATPTSERARPLGIVAAIVSARSPLVAAAMRVAPALACGNTVVLKPARATPLAALALAEICADAGLPPGIFNVVTGDGAVDEALVDHADVDAIAFSGARERGMAIARAVAGSKTRLTLEIASPVTFLVFDDAPLDDAVDAVLARGAGRVLVAESAADEMLETLGIRLEALRHGDPLDANTDVGPVATREDRDRAAGTIAMEVAAGARVLRASWIAPDRGFWIPTTVVARDAAPHAPETTAGDLPPIAISTFRTPVEGIERANERGGAAVSVWTMQGALAERAARGLRAGVVWFGATDLSEASVPQGGSAEAGTGRFGGVPGLQGYLQF